MYRATLLVVLLAGCATAGQSQRTGDDDVDAGTDAPSIDAPEPCIEVTTDLLVNGNFDMAPDGVGWTATPVDAAFPIVTGDDGVTEQTAPLKAWMGGFAQANANDQLFQDIAIPARTSAMTLTGFYDVRTAETIGTARDRATVALTEVGGTVLETVLATDNTQEKTDWTPLDHTFPNAAALSGTTVRLVFATSNDATANTPTSFYFDTLALTATHCQ